MGVSMNPWQLAKESESSHQIALFCWAAKAEKMGFSIANNKLSYKTSDEFYKALPIPELKWLHHIPNGGSRGDTAKSRAIAGGQLKAEGVKAGVHDLFWPVSRRFGLNPHGFCGLYIEMKRPSEKTTKAGGLSQAQIEFGNFAHSQGYKVAVAYSWEEAAKIIEDYWNLGV
jgi:hypothetical protein